MTSERPPGRDPDQDAPPTTGTHPSYDLPTSFMPVSDTSGPTYDSFTSARGYIYTASDASASQAPERPPLDPLAPALFSLYSPAPMSHSGDLEANGRSLLGGRSRDMTARISVWHHTMPLSPTATAPLPLCLQTTVREFPPYSPVTT